MKKEVCKSKVEELISQAAASMQKNANKLLSSGVIKFDDYSNDSYLLPKMVVRALLMEEEHQFKPLLSNKQMDKDVIDMYAML